MESLGLHVLALTLVLQAGASNGPGKASEGEAVRSVLDKYTKACEARNFGALSSLFSHDPDIVVINAASPNRLAGWKNVAEMYKAVFSASGEVKVRHKNIRVKMLASGKAACLVCDQDLNGTYQGKTFTLEGVRVTWVLEKQEGQWRIVHAHWSLPAGPEAGSG